ncbi:MAG: flagellin lysine-N-methylase [Lachnospira sp.]
MKLRVPYYYDDFHCIAGECKDNCCVGGWEIDIDEDTYNYYQNLEGELGERIRESITKTDEYCFKLNNGNCPFLLENGLCEIHSKLGEEHLGVVCSQFPRFSEYYGEIKETGIGLACEESERIIFSSDKHFTMVEKDCEEEPVEDSEYDESFAQKIFKARDCVFKILERDDMSIHERLIVLLSMANDMQECINSDDFDGIDRVVTMYRREQPEIVLQNLCEEFDDGSFSEISSVKDEIRKILYIYEDMEVLSPEWDDAIKDLITNVHEGMSDDDYNIFNEEFLRSQVGREYEYRNLLEYFVYRYYAKSIYDYNVLGKIQMIVSNFLVIKEFDILRWFKNHKRFSFQDRIDTVHVFSRQVEYSEDNIEIMYDGFLFDDVFTCDNLMKLLWIDSATS